MKYGRGESWDHEITVGEVVLLCHGNSCTEAVVERLGGFGVWVNGARYWRRNGRYAGHGAGMGHLKRVRHRAMVERSGLWFPRVSHE
jgi:hypothetical protein